MTEEREPMEEDNVIIDTLEEYYGVKDEMIRRQETLLISKLTPRLRGELTQDEIWKLEEPFYPRRNQEVVKTKDSTKHRLFNQTLQEIKNKITPYDQACKLKNTPSVNLKIISYTGKYGLNLVADLHVYLLRSQKY